jgi:hypothetical protein
MSAAFSLALAFLQLFAGPHPREPLGPHPQRSQRFALLAPVITVT